jgi:hypothetical protein
LFLGSLSVEERIAEARAYAVAAAIRNAPPGEDLTLQVGTAEDPDVIELSRHRRRASSRVPNVRLDPISSTASGPRRAIKI